MELAEDVLRLNITSKVKDEMDNIVLQEDEGKSEFLLGCHIQSDLKWHKQISLLLAKLRARLVGLGKLKYICPYAVRKTIAEGIFNSVLVYCLPLYGGLDVGDLKDLQVLQNKAAQCVTLSPPRAKRSLMFDRLCWLTVNQLIYYHSIITIFKIRICKEPEYLASISVKDSRNSRIIIPNLDLTLAQKSFTVRGAVNWNQLHLNITKTDKIGPFKKLAKKWIFENVPRFLE